MSRRAGVAAFVGAAVVGAFAAQITVDDSDSSINYSPSSRWREQSLPGDEAYGGSVTVTDSYGASVSFKFVGTSCEVYGPTGPLSGTGTLVFDGTEHNYDFSSDPGAVAYNNLLFSQSNLADGEHSFTLTNTASDQYIWIDRIVYEASSVSSSGSSSGPSAASSSSSPSFSTISNAPTNSLVLTTTVINGTTITSQVIATQTQTTGTDVLGNIGGNHVSTASDSSAQKPSSLATATSRGSGSPVGPIVGGVLGGLVVAAAVLSLLVWYFKRRNQNNTTPQSVSVINDKSQDYSDQTDWSKRFVQNPFITPMQSYMEIGDHSPDANSHHFVIRSSSPHTPNFARNKLI